MTEHVLGVVAGRYRLVDPCPAAGIEPGEQESGLHLGGGDGQPVDDRKRDAGALDGKRQPAALAEGETGAGFGQRIGHATHGPAPQTRVAGHDGEQGVGREQAGEEAGRRAGVAHVEHVGGFGQAADAAPADAPGAGSVVVDGGAECPHGGGGSEHVFALEDAVDTGFADRQGGEHQRTMADRLIAWDADGSGEGRCRRTDDERPGGGHGKPRIPRRGVFDSARGRWHGRPLRPNRRVRIRLQGTR